jgi:hypothetical protein
VDVTVEQPGRDQSTLAVDLDIAVESWPDLEDAVSVEQHIGEERRLRNPVEHVAIPEDQT